MPDVSDQILQRLMDWGVRRVFGYPGDAINGLMGALNRHKGDIDFIQVRHEEMAAFMACAYAKFSGEVGVCAASAGPGAIHLLNGLYDAKMDGQPVVAFLGQLPRHAMGTFYQQEVDLHNLFKDVAGDYIHTLNTPDQTRHLVDQAIRIAKAERTVTCVILPHDVQNLPAVAQPKREHNRTFSGVGFSVPVMIPTEPDLVRAADVLNAGNKVAMLIGAGAKNATDEIIIVAETLKAGIAKALLGLPVLPNDVPYVTGSIGLLGTHPSWELMSACDTLLMVGSDFPYAEFLPREGQARGVQIDIKPRALSLRYPMEVNLTGDARETLRALLPYLKTKTDDAWQQKIIQSVRQWRDLLRDRAMINAEPMNPQRAFYEIFERLPEDAVITVDTGTTTVWYAQYHKFRRGMTAALSGRLASMGAAIPYAVAAKYAHPDRPVIAFVGDGAMQMNGINELVTISKYWRDWSDPRLIIVVLNNRELNFVTWEMRVMEGDPKFKASQDLPDFPYAYYAQSLGLGGLGIKTEAAFLERWQYALDSPVPIVFEIQTSPDIPPLPPHINIKQAKNFTLALMKGDPDSVEIIKKAFQEMVTR